MARQESLYDFHRVWATLQSQGWHSKRGPNGDYFIKPGKSIDDEEGVDYLYGEAAVSMYAIQIGLFEGDDNASFEPQREAVKGSAASGHEEKVREEALKPKANGKQKKERSAAAPPPPRQWPDSHPKKGRHVADAISLLDSDDNGELEDGEMLEEKASAVAVELKVENVKEEQGAETMRPNSGKRKGLYVDDDDEEEEEEEDEGDDLGHDASAMDVDAGWRESSEDDGGAQSDSSSMQPLPTLRDFHTYITKANGGKRKHYYQPTPMMARKAKPAPRGLMPRVSNSPPRASNKPSKKQRRGPEPAAEGQTAEQNTPPQPPQPALNPPAAQDQANALGRAAEAELVGVVPLPVPSSGRVRQTAKKCVSAPRPLVLRGPLSSETTSQAQAAELEAAAAQFEAELAVARAAPARIRQSAQKSRSTLRALIPSAPSSSRPHAQSLTASLNGQHREHEPGVQTQTTRQDTPAQHSSTSQAVEPRVPKAEGAAMKPEPEHASAQPSISPPSHPAERASSVAAAPANVAPPTATDPKSDSASRPIVRLDVDGVVFKSFPEEMYHVVVTEDPDASETSIAMEERATKVQMQLTYSDISKYSEPPESVHAVPLTPALVYQGLSLLLKRASETVLVDNPPLGVTTEDDGSPFADFDLVRENESCEIVMEFPKMSFLRQVHRFPMALVPESPRVQVVLRELERTKQELEAAQRDIEAFKRQHELQQRENQKLREALEQEQRRPPSRASTPPPQPTVAPRPQVDPVPVLAPVPAPSPRAQDAVAFHAQSSWLGTAHPEATTIAGVATWALKWERIIEASANHYEVTAGDAASTAVKFIMRGSYQLNLSVIHDTSRRLVAMITSHSNQSRQLKPSSTQVIETKNKTRHRSRIDQIIHCDVGDTIVVQLQARNESDALHGNVLRLTSLAAHANKWMMLFIDPQFVLAGQ